MVNRRRLILFFIILMLIISAAFFYFFYINDTPQNHPIAIKNEFPDLSGQIKNDIERISQSINPPNFPDRECRINDYGASPGENNLNSSAINSAIDDCSKKGGGSVVVPQGKWMSGAIKLKSNINLHLDEGAELIFTIDRKEFLPPVFTRFQGMEVYNYSPLIYAKDAQNIAITGKGKIVGNGETWWRWAQNTPSRQTREKLFEMSLTHAPIEKRQFAGENMGLRPSFIQTVNCQNILVDGISVVDGPMWTLHFIYSKNILVKNANIDTYSSNTDGIVVDSSSDVLIEDNLIAAGDDGIAIKSGLEDDGLRVNRPSENIIIRHNRITRAHGAVAIGSEMSGGVRNVYVYNSYFITTDNGFRLKTTDSRGGFVENVHVENVMMENIENDAIVIDLSYGSKLASSADRIPFIKNIHLRNIDITGALRLLKVDGIMDGPMEDIVLNDIEAVCKDGVYLNEASNITFDGINLSTHNPGPYFDIREGKNISVLDYVCPKGNNLCFKIRGKKTDNIDLSKISFDKDRIEMEKRLTNKIKIK